MGAFEFPLRFPGQYADKETGQHYNYFRDCYDPATGRFCQPDPAGTVFFRDMAFRDLGGVGLTQPRLADALYSETLHYNHLYLYAKANPLKYTDPLGLLVVPAGAASIIFGDPTGSGSAGGGQASSSGTIMCAVGNERSSCLEMCDVIRKASTFACAGNPACITQADRLWRGAGNAVTLRIEESNDTL